MSVTFPEFATFLQNWIANAPEVAAQAFPSATWRKVFRLCDHTPSGGLRLDAAMLNDALFAGQGGRYMHVASLLSEAVAGAFPGSDDAAGTSPGPSRTSGDSRTTIEDLWSAAFASVRSRVPRSQGAADAPREEASPTAAMPAAAQPPATPVPDESQTSWSFPSYDYSRANLDAGDEEGGTPIAVTVSVMENGALRYSWPDPGAGEVYRVVVSDEEQVYDPADGVEIAVTQGLTCSDASDHPYALHFVSVWGYECLPGTQELGQGRRIASCVYVHPVAGWTAQWHAESRTVIGRWEQPLWPAGVQGRVLTAKLPMGQAPKKYLRGSAWRAYEVINAGTGFQDRELMDGRRHHYVAVAEAELDGQTHTSTAQLASVMVPVRVERIEDLAVEQVETPSAATRLSLTMTWTETTGANVTIFVTNTLPNQAAVTRGTIPVSQLPTAGFREDDRVTIPAEIDDAVDDPNHQRRRIVAAPWKNGVEWDSIFVTAVVLNGDEAVLSEPVRLKRVFAPSDAVVRRHAGSHDLITFAWPGHAADVAVSTDPLRQSVVAEVDHDRYARDGGVMIPAGVLPPQGGVVYLSARELLAGEETISRAVPLEIPPLWVYRYEVAWPSLMSKFRKHVAEITIRSDAPVTDDSQVFTVCLMRHRDHLPLLSRDGEQIPLMLQEPEKGVTPQSYPAVRVAQGSSEITVWFDPNEAQDCLVRLMILEKPVAQVQGGPGPVLEHYALLDPPVSTLDRTSRRRRWFS